MSNVLIRNVPEQVHSRLQVRARARGQSLQQYLFEELSRLAEQPSMEEVLARIESREGGRVGFDMAATDLHIERDAR